MPKACGKPLRCAVYTRKSSEEGLEQSFNSLHAQREACEAYILSQKHEGWQLVPAPYDDGGWSGGSMERPGLKALLADIAAGSIDIIVVYKVDRLTRSLADFAKMVELFDARKVSFVSVTQAFNTTSSMGRLTLNVLLSFAQFEREVTGERIRDKIAASKAKGLWMGGIVPLGYKAAGRTLTINEVEAEQVRWLYRQYLQLKAVDALVTAAAKAGIVSKPRAKGGGQPLTRGSLYRILGSPLYVGEIPHGRKRHPGQHPAIVDRKLHDAVQVVLAANRRKKVDGRKAGPPALLAGLVSAPDGARLVSTHTRKGRQRYRYYASPVATSEDKRLRVPAVALEKLVVDAVVTRLGTKEAMAEDLIGSADLVTALATAGMHAARLARGNPVMRRQLALLLIAQVAVMEDHVAVRLRLGAIDPQLGDTLTEITVAAALGKRKASLALVITHAASHEPDRALLAQVARARSWFEELRTGAAQSLADLARREQIAVVQITRLLPLAFVPASTIRAIASGQQLDEMTTAELLRLAR